MQALRDRDYVTAAAYFDKLGEFALSDDRLAKAAGFTYLQLGNDDRALKFLAASLKGRSAQPEVHAALGDIYVRRMEQKKALAHLRKAVLLAPHAPELNYKLGLALIGFERFEEAVTEMRAALALNPQYLKARLGLGRALTELGKLEKAETELRRAKELAPQNYAVSLRIGNLREKQQRFDDAISCYQEAETQSGHAAPICEALALAELVNGKADAALDTLKRGLHYNPFDISLLKHTANLRYEMGDPEAFSYYDSALKNRHLQRVHADYITRLALAGRSTDAMHQLQRYETEFGQCPDWFSLAAQLHYNEGSYSEMLRIVARAPANNSGLMTWKTKALISSGEIDEAQSLLTSLLEEAPRDQQLLALLTTCYRLTDNPAYHELVNYEDLLIRSELAVPAGFSNLVSFNEALRETLEELHITRANPLSQSVIGGTQTPGNLLQRPQPVIVALKQALHTTLLRELGSSFYKNISQTHPVSVGLGHSINLPTCWSIWVTEGGYHRPHIHSKGWYSSAYYVSLPSVLRTDDRSGNEGALAFGRPGLETPIPLEAERVIAPAEGILTLFPSYFWHETLPFRGEEARVAVAFDALPAR